MENLASGIIQKGLVKIKLAFGVEVTETERTKILETWAARITRSDINVLETHHYKTMSSLLARINRPHCAR